MDLEYINIIQESCEDMAAIFDYDNNYTLARPYLQEAEEQKEGLIKRGIGAIIRFCQRIYGWFSEKIGIIKEAIKKKLFNNNKVIAAAAEKQLEKEEAKAPSQPAAPTQPVAKTEPKQAEKPAAPVKQLSKERKAIFDSIRQIIKGLRSGSNNSYEAIYNAGFGPYRDKFSEEEKSMDTYDFTFGQENKDAAGFLFSVANIASNIEMKIEVVLDKADFTNQMGRGRTKDQRSALNKTLLDALPIHFNRGSSFLEKPITKIKDDCFKVIIRTSSLCSNGDQILEKFKTNDLNKLSRMLDKGLKKNKIHDKEFLKTAHEYLLGAFQLKQVIFNKITNVLNIAAQQFSMSARKCIELLFKLSRKV